MDHSNNIIAALYTVDIRILQAIDNYMDCRNKEENSFQQIDNLVESISFFSLFVHGQRCMLLPVCKGLDNGEYTFRVELAENGFVIGRWSVLELSLVLS